MTDQILDAREQRFLNILELSKKCKVLISLKANTPGEDKNRYSSYFLINQFDYLINQSFDIISRYTYNGPDGPYYVYSINREMIEEIKKELIYIEDTHFLGRLIDLDLYFKGENISRDHYNIKQRTCMLCNQLAFECIKSNKHILSDILYSKIQDYITNKLLVFLDKSILLELNLENKFGLVTPSSNGSHHDMDYDLMLKSKDVILPFLIDIFVLGFTHDHDHQLYHKARAIGLKAELAMLEKTDQVNTYKGLIYLLGFVLLSTGYLIKNHLPFKDIFSQVKYLAKDVMLDFEKDPQTSGMKSFLEHQITGIRGEVFKGLPTIQKALKHFSNIDTFDKKHQHHLLLFFMQHCEDTVLLKRSGSLSNYHHYKQMAAQVNPYVDKDIKSFTTYCINNHISFGGSADLFVVFHFLKYIEQIL